MLRGKIGKEPSKPITQGPKITPNVFKPQQAPITIDK